MKARNRQANSEAKGEEPKRQGERPKPTSPEPSRGRLWFFRLAAMFLVPGLFLCALEITLRVAGYGHPTRYFLRTKIGGEEYFIPNYQFGLRFFPPALARNPLPLRVPVEKPPGTCRIFVFGESAAQGDPDPSFGFGRYLESLLRERFPGTDFEVICVAMTAINSHVILPIARECAGLNGDLWLVYMGNNEMVGPFGAGTVFGPTAPPLAVIRASLALKTTRVGQLLDSLLNRAGRAGAAHKSWGGMKMFLDHQVRAEDPSRLRVYRHFQSNLEDILRAGETAGVPIVLSTVASNLKDCGPFGSLHSPGLSEEDAGKWEELFSKGKVLEAAAAYGEAATAYREAALLDPHYAELQFRLASCELAIGSNTLAQQAFVLARDEDTLAFRADTRVNQAIREVGAREAKRGVTLLDAVEEMSRTSPAHIPGRDLFYEHVHYHFHGNYLLAKAFGEKVLAVLPSRFKAHDRGSWAKQEECESRLAVNVWEEYRLWNVMFRRLHEAPFSSQADHANSLAGCQKRMDEIEEAMNRQTPEQARATYETALAKAPNDYFLQSNFSEFLEGRGDFASAYKHQEALKDLLPDEPVPYYKLGRLSLLLGKSHEAINFLRKALAVRPGFPQALNELGISLANQQKFDGARQSFEQALRLNPDYSETYLNLGFLAQAEGDLATAKQRYQEAARLEVDGPCAYFFQGVSQASEHQRAAAITSFRQAVQLKPGFWQASYLMGVELAGMDNLEEARREFAETLRYRPDYAKAHVNLGVALARQRKFDDARTEFQTALTLSPTNKLAQQHLQTLEHLKSNHEN